MNPILPSNPEAYNVATISTVIANVLRLAVGVAGIVAVIYIIIGAYSYLTAYGNEERAGEGKKTLTWAIVGLIVILASELIITLVWNFLSGNNPTFLI